jgi:hypothetical protein
MKKRESERILNELIAAGILDRYVGAKGEAVAPSEKCREFLTYVVKNDDKFKLKMAKNLNEYTHFACSATIIALSPTGSIPVKDVHKYATVLWRTSGLDNPPESIKEDYMKWHRKERQG